MPQPAQHVLSELRFPARYEDLASALGPEISRLIAAPNNDTLSNFRRLALEVRARGEGMFVPMLASTGAGKTTFASQLVFFLPSDFRPTIQYTSDTVTFQGLLDVASEAGRLGVANESRILPILVDNREGAPATALERAAMKRFAREQTIGRRSVILWPDTDTDAAHQMASAYVEMAGAPAISIPTVVQGPPSNLWQQIATHTVELANAGVDVTQLGVSPNDYEPDESPSLGEFLRRISADYTRRQLQLLESTQKPLRLSILFASGSTDAGVLAQLTNSNKVGLLDGAALLSATRQSVVGRTWADRRGLLTQIIVQLDARAFSLPPQVTVPAMRTYGPDDVRTSLRGANGGAYRVKEALRGSDFGKFLNGRAGATFENRGRPTRATASFNLMAGLGFTSGRDKQLNRGMLKALELYFADQDISASSLAAEQGLGFVPLTPDNSFEIAGEQHCIEYTWRSGTYLAAGRGAVAEYILQKLENYARELGQLSD